MSDYASESGHWYGADGEPRYTIIGKNGKERATTLRDARALNLSPSVTTIIRMGAAPALERWKRNQVLLAALTLPRGIGESETDWLARVERDWQEQGRSAADRGTAIHGAVECAYRGEPVPADYALWADAVRAAVLLACGPQDWRAERSFAHRLGYGGKLDLHSDEWVVDIKTKDGDPSGQTVYDEHLMQLAAYRRGIGAHQARCGIVFVSRDEPAAAFVEAPAGEPERGLRMFDALLSYWQAKHSYVPVVA